MVAHAKKLLKDDSGTPEGKEDGESIAIGTKIMRPEKSIYIIRKST